MNHMYDVPPLLVERNTNGKLWKISLIFIAKQSKEFLDMKISFHTYIYKIIFQQKMFMFHEVTLTMSLNPTSILIGNKSKIVCMAIVDQFNVVNIKTLLVYFKTFRHSGIKCESESEILLTVAITTLVNFLFFGFIMIAKNWICDSYQFGKEL